MIEDRIGPTAITTANVALGSAVPAGQTFTLRSVLIQQPTAGLLKEVLLGIGSTGTPANVVRRITLTAGVQNYLEYPNIVLKAGEQLNVISSADTGVAVLSAHGYRELAS